MASKCVRWLPVLAKPGVASPSHCCVSVHRITQVTVLPIRYTSNGGNISSTQTAQVLPKRNHVRNILLAVGGTGSLYVAYRIYSAPTDEVKQAKNWQVKVVTYINI